MKCILPIVFLIYTPLSLAFFCPNNFKQIDYDNTIDQVIASCGQPSSQETKKEKPLQPQEWVYYIKFTPNSSSSLRASVFFDSTGKVVSMSVSGYGLTQSNICNGGIKIGDDMKAVQAACGAPAMTTETTGAGANTEETEVTTLTYKSNTGEEQLIFKNKKLTETK